MGIPNCLAPCGLEVEPPLVHLCIVLLNMIVLGVVSLSMKMIFPLSPKIIPNKTGTRGELT